ncbi:MAG: cation:proton antiporter [Clostridia bacterium]|nr:cation:proton antiporter [Clostridia bacterium]
MQTLLEIAIAMTAGLFVSRLAKMLKLPAVTGYLVAGILVGPYFLGRFGIGGLGFVDAASVQALGLISDVALGFIAFSIGNEFRLSQLKTTGKQATVIGIVQAVVATLTVDVILIALHFAFSDKLSLPMAILLGAIASATAPAATLMVVRQYKSEGKLTDLLLPIVALDDAVGLVIFAISFGVAKAMLNGNVDMVSILVNPLAEIVLSLVLGTVMGILFSMAEKFFHSNSKRLSLAVTAVILTVALSKLQFAIGPVQIGFSSLLVCMMLGTVFCNMCDFSDEIMAKTDKWTAPLFMLFFVISGAELELNVFADVTIVIIGLTYILARSAGKYFGSRWSAGWVHCDENIRKYLGVTLLPQAGVALGMSVTAQSLGADGSMVRNIVLFGVLIYELIGPLCTKLALTKAGDIHPKADVQAIGDADEDEE